MKQILEELLTGALIAVVLICSVAIIGILIFATYKEVFHGEITPQPTVECTDGQIYDVFYDGNITIYEKRPFTTCEER